MVFVGGNCVRLGKVKVAFGEIRSVDSVVIVSERFSEAVNFRRIGVITTVIVHEDKWSVAFEIGWFG
jgi:hypothetical protein